MTPKKLHTIKNTGFKVPKDYFSNMEEAILNDVRLMEHSTNSGFNTPKNYFDQVEDSILKNVKNEPRVIWWPSQKHRYFVTGIAASIILLLAIFMNKDNKEEISVEMVETHFENSDLNSYELARLLSEADMLPDDFVISETPYDENNIESYLLENSDIEILLQ